MKLKGGPVLQIFVKNYKVMADEKIPNGTMQEKVDAAKKFFLKDKAAGGHKKKYANAKKSFEDRKAARKREKSTGIS